MPNRVLTVTTASPAASRGQDGAAIVEFVMVLPILLMIVLVMVQSSLLMAGNLCVHYSAYCAARGAIVYVPFDSPPTEPPNAVLGSSIDSYKRMRIKQAAVWALAQFHEPEALPALMSEAERPHPVIQSFLANALGAFQDSRVIPVLAKLASHPSREVAFQAACALGETGDRQGIPVLQKSWRRRDALIRAASAITIVTSISRSLGHSP